MHILFLTDNFPPEVNAPASRTFEHCREWVRAGEQVTVITGVPNFPKGRAFEGYRNRLWQEEDLAGIRVIRVWTYIAANEGFARRIVDYLSFMVAAIIGSFRVRQVDVVVGTSPQFFTACAARVIGLLKRVPWVFELRDIWPESIRAVGAMKSSRSLDLLERVEMYLYRHATLIVSVTHAFRDILVRRGIDASKIAVITNGVDGARFAPRAKDRELVERYGLEGKFVAGYIGTHGMAHALDTILDAAALLSQAEDYDEFRFLMLGDGAEKEHLLDRARRDKLKNVIFIDTVPKDEVVRFWSLLDVSVIHLKRTDLFKTVIPSKLFESMGMGIPILHGVEGESAEIVRREHVGLLFEPENAKELRGDRHLYEELRSNGPRTAGNYDRTILARSMLELIHRAAI
jgi:glycosyltransferase involved in cell wall biosynthesis